VGGKDYVLGLEAEVARLRGRSVELFSWVSAAIVRKSALESALRAVVDEIENNNEGEASQIARAALNGEQSVSD